MGRPVSAAARMDALAYAEKLEKEGVLYIWDGDILGSWPDLYVGEGLDCSGFVGAVILFATKGTVDWRHRWWCDRMFQKLPATLSPKPMDLALYGKDGLATHVAFVVGDGRIIEAGGGGSSCYSREIALRKPNARVRYKPSHLYRVPNDFLGFRTCTPLENHP